VSVPYVTMCVQEGSLHACACLPSVPLAVAPSARLLRHRVNGQPAGFPRFPTVARTLCVRHRAVDALPLSGTLARWRQWGTNRSDPRGGCIVQCWQPGCCSDRPPQIGAVDREQKQTERRGRGGGSWKEEQGNGKSNKRQVRNVRTV
jgi:hypothetical protein